MMLSVILPVYNEGNRLEACVDRLRCYLAENVSSYEIIIAEDGSTDESYPVAKRLAKEYDDVALFHSDNRLGRGASLDRAIKRANGDYIVYMDVDLATDLRYTKILIDGLANGASVVTGSRLMKGSKAKRPLVRDVASKGYNLLIKLLFGSALHDHQCGFKGFNKRVITQVLDWVQDSHWFWDTELLIICQQAGLKIFEFPVHWVHNGGNSLNQSKVKVLKDAYQMGSKLLDLKCRLSARKVDFAQIRYNLADIGILSRWHMYETGEGLHKIFYADAEDVLFAAMHSPGDLGKTHGR